MQERKVWFIHPPGLWKYLHIFNSNPDIQIYLNQKSESYPRIPSLSSNWWDSLFSHHAVLLWPPKWRFFFNFITFSPSPQPLFWHGFHHLLSDYRGSFLASSLSLIHIAYKILIKLKCNYATSLLKILFSPLSLEDNVNLPKVFEDPQEPFRSSSPITFHITLCRYPT